MTEEPSAPPDESGLDGGEDRNGPTSMPRGLDKLLRTALIIIPIGVVGNIVFSLAITDREVLREISSFPRGYLLSALALGILPWFTNTLRLRIWTRFLGHPLSFRDALKIVLATDMGAAVSPTAVGGGLFKWGLLVQRGVSPGAAASLTALSPLEDGLFFLVSIPLALWITASWRHPALSAVADEFRESALLVLVIGAAIAVTTWLAVTWVLGGGLGKRTQRHGRRFVSRIRRSLRTTWLDARGVYRMIRLDGKSRFAVSMTLTAIQWIARYSIISVLIAFLGAPVQPVLFWLLQWVVFTLAAFIPTPGAAGGAEAAFFLIYTPFVPAEILGLATAGWRFFTFYLLLGLAALIYFVIGGTRGSSRG